MALRPTVVLSLLTFALLAGCSDGPPSGDLVAIPGSLDVNGSTAENTYVARSGGQDNPAAPGERLCPPEDVPQDAIPLCVEASSHYKVHFMSLPEPAGDGYQVFQMGGAIEERSLCNLQRGTGDMWECEITKDGQDESSQFERLDLRMGDFTIASASSAGGSQAFVANPALSSVTVSGSYKGRTLSLDVQGLPAGPEYVGRFYTRGISGNLTVAESFQVVAGAQELETELDNVGAYEEFHIHVGTSKIYVYQATI